MTARRCKFKNLKIGGDDGDVPDIVHLVAQLGSELDPKYDT